MFLFRLCGCPEHLGDDPGPGDAFLRLPHQCHRSEGEDGLDNFQLQFHLQASMVIGSIIFSAGCALTSITIQQVYLRLFS